MPIQKFEDIALHTSGMLLNLSTIVWSLVSNVFATRNFSLYRPSGAVLINTSSVVVIHPQIE